MDPELFNDDLRPRRQRKLSDLKPLNIIDNHIGEDGLQQTMRIQLQFPEGEDNHILLSNQNQKIKYAQIINKREQHMQFCDVCLEATDDYDNKLIFCDLCKFGVHQSGYGSDLTPAAPRPSSWFSQKCWYLIYNDLQTESISCYFCTELQGIMKKVKNGNNIWVRFLIFYLMLTLL